MDISKYPRGEFLFFTWGRKNSSEESNETSEEMNHAHVENKKSVSYTHLVLLRKFFHPSYSRELEYKEIIMQPASSEEAMAKSGKQSSRNPQLRA